MRLVRTGFWMLAVLAGGLLVPVATARAEKIVVKNGTPAPVVVQGTAVVKGVLVRDRAHLVLTTDVTPPIVLPGNKVLTVYDARNANRILAQIPIPSGNLDMNFEVVPDQTSATGVRLLRR